jgi:ribosomal protein S27AE
LEDVKLSRCPFCGGAGVVSYWSECLNFEDRRFCARCEAGGALANKLAEILARIADEESDYTVNTSQVCKALP